MNKLLLLLPLLFLSCGKDKPTAVTKTYAIRFEVRGFIGRVDIDYNDGKIARQAYNMSNTALPWAYSFSAASRDNISVRAHIRAGLISGGQDISSIATLIYLGDELHTSSPLARGQGASAESSITLP